MSRSDNGCGGNGVIYGASGFGGLYRAAGS
jgi:hypothetical protein